MSWLIGVALVAWVILRTLGRIRAGVRAVAGAPSPRSAPSRGSWIGGAAVAGAVLVHLTARIRGLEAAPSLIDLAALVAVAALGGFLLALGLRVDAAESPTARER